MPGHGEEDNRAFGVPRGGPARDGQARAHRPEPQRVLGFPVTVFRYVDVEFFRGFVHPVSPGGGPRGNRDGRGGGGGRLGASAVAEDTPRRDR